MGVSLNGGTPISHPKMIISSRKIPIVVGETHHFQETSKIYTSNFNWTILSVPQLGENVQLPAGETKLRLLLSEGSVPFFWQTKHRTGGSSSLETRNFLGRENCWQFCWRRVSHLVTSLVIQRSCLPNNDYYWNKALTGFYNSLGSLHSKWFKWFQNAVPKLSCSSPQEVCWGHCRCDHNQASWWITANKC